MYLICTKCGKRNQDHPLTTCSCGQPLEVQYDWDHIPKNVINVSAPSLWRYHAVLPHIQNQHIISLGEGWTPLVKVDKMNGIQILAKDETVNPTGSFKDRGMSLAISMAKEQGVERVCLPSAGNAGIAAAAYARTAGLDCHVFLPDTIPYDFIAATEKYDAFIYQQGKSIADAAELMHQKKETNWFDISTLKEPFRVEGKKTMGYELAEQLDWTLPDVIIYPTGGGTGLIGMWKAFNEMHKLGWITGKLPRMVAAQSSGCCPVVQAFTNDSIDIEFWSNSYTSALGLNVPSPSGGAWMLQVIRASAGCALAVPEEEIAAATEEVRAKTGIHCSAEAGVVWHACKQLVNKQWITANEQVVLFITGKERLI